MGNTTSSRTRMSPGSRRIQFRSSSSDVETREKRITFWKNTSTFALRFDRPSLIIYAHWTLQQYLDLKLKKPAFSLSCFNIENSNVLHFPCVNTLSPKCVNVTKKQINIGLKLIYSNGSLSCRSLVSYISNNI